MAGHKDQRTHRSAAGLTAALFLGLSGCGIFAKAFQVSGTVTVAAHLQAKIPRTNAVLFIIIKNGGQVPVAVRRIVNPEFPLDFSLREEDLIVPGASPAGPLTIEAQLNTHGNVGSPAKGDLGGVGRRPVRGGERGVRVLIDREI